MTVSSVVVRAVAGWSGVETEFPTGIQVLTKSQLVVSLVPDEGARLPLTMGLHYAVNLSPAGVATVLPLPAFPAMHGEVSFVRRTPMTQDYDPTATDTYDAAGHAAALDRSAMRVAELSQAVDDIAAASVVVEGGAASVPAGAVYVSDGAGRAIPGPTAAEIESARVEAVGAASTATTAAGTSVQAAGAAGGAAALADQLANAAPNIPVGSGFSMRHWLALAEALVSGLDLSNYETTEQIIDRLADYVQTTRKVKTGAAFLLNGTAGTNDAPAEADLSADLLFKLIFASTAETLAGERDNLPVHPAGMKAAIDGALAGFSAGGIKGVQVFKESRTYNPTDGATKALVIATGGGASGSTGSTNNYGGGAGGAGATAIALVDAEVATVTIGAGGANRGTAANLLGTNGGDTSFGSIVAGGAPACTSGYAGGQGGNTGADAAVLLPGGAGSHGQYVASQGYSGNGGASFWGGGGRGGVAGTSGNAGAAPGSGGGGGPQLSSSGAGANGIVLVLEF